MITSIKLTTVLVILISLHNKTSAAMNRQKRSSAILTPFKNLAAALWNTLKNEKMEVSLVIICRNHSQHEEEIRVSLDGYKPASALYSIPRKEIVFITHGFMSDGDAPWLKDLARAYLDRKEIIVFIVDWGTGAKVLSYSEAVKNVKIVAKMLIDFISHLIQCHNVEASRIHLIGYSLGAHLCGSVGKEISEIKRITGLDPPEKGFEIGSNLRLSKNDALYVDVVHTNTIKDGYGLRDSIGHVDFFINGGENQPGCTSFLQSLDFLYKYPCSHYRSVEYFIESIKHTECVFVGTHKFGNSSYTFTTLGLDTFKYQNVTGDYYINTNSQSPYCKK